jgi:hypothetical protein
VRRVHAIELGIRNLPFMGHDLEAGIAAAWRGVA